MKVSQNAFFSLCFLQQNISSIINEKQEMEEYSSTKDSNLSGKFAERKNNIVETE